MIPVSLSVKNFLSYGDQVPTLDFTLLHVVCLSGDNGHGKSALLDAITWALWGEARKATGDRKPDERLLRMGTTDMAVTFEFDLEGDRYRILRQYRSGRGGKSNLEFQVFNGASGGYISLTQPSITATQQKITDTLRMDYNTFINSVFILQGRADEFTRRSARDRKVILADILGLWRYDELRERARLRMQQVEQGRDECDRRLLHIDETLEGREACLDTIAALNTCIQEISSQIKQIDRGLGALQIRQAEFGQAEMRLTELQTQYTGLQEEYEDLTSQIAAQKEKLDAFQTALKDRQTIEKSYQDYQTLNAGNETFNRKLQILRGLEQRLTEFERFIDAARHEVEKQRQAFAGRRESVERTIEETSGLLSQRERIERGYRELQQARQSDEQWEDKRRRHDEIERQIRECQDTLIQARTTLQGELGGYQHRLKDLQAKAEKAEQHHEMVADRRRRLEALRRLEKMQLEIEERGRSLNGQIEVLKNRIKLFEHEDDDANTKLKMLRRGLSANCPLCDAVLDDRRRMTIEANLGETVKQHAEEIRKHTLGIKHFQEESQTLRVKFKENAPKLKSLPQAQQALVEAEAAAREAEAAAREAQTLGRQVRMLQERLDTRQYAPEAQQNIQALTREQAAIGYDADRHNEIKSSLRDLQGFEGEKSRFDDAYTRYRTASAAIPEIDEKLMALDRQLQEKAYAPDESRMLDEIRQEIQALGYDEARHKDTERRLTPLKDIQARKEQLDQAVRQFDTVQEALQEREKRVGAIQEKRTRIMTRINELEAGTREKEGVEKQIQTLKMRRTALQNELDETNRQSGAEQAEAARFEMLAAERPGIEAQRNKDARDAQVYEKLATAFGKDGIQALIIENAIPEIEEEANNILSRLTGNRTQITIEPLRNLKTGGTKETLDIHISDEMGTRPYEMFSGGEAFRSNFALRIALSKLLAHRAGTRLRTLVIDEGFGTQDEQGLEYLVEALQGIQGDFEKIIVVTHLERLKNAFPARIEVTKYPDVGSRFEVIM